MDKMKKYLLYIVLLVVFALFSSLLITVGLNSSYKSIERKEDNLSYVNIYQAEATKVNGRIRGFISDSRTRIKRKIYKN